MIRQGSIYISVETKKHLWLIAKAKDLANADEAGELLLSAAISEHFPAIVEHQKKIDQLESELLTGLTK